MRVAILSDIHGNLLALEAVLKDIEARGGVDECWVLGDLVAVGPQPVEVLECLHQLPNVRFTRGNTDRYVTDGDRPIPTQEEALNNPEILAKVVQIAEGFAWTQGAVTAHGWYAFLKTLPLETRLTLPDGTRLLGVHASPGRDDGNGIHPQLSDDELSDLIAGAEAELICVGNTHWPLKRNVGDVQVVNLGGVSNPAEPSLQATYCLLEANESSYQIKHHQVDYDREAVIELARERVLPTRDYITFLLSGKGVRPWGELDI
mgnify:CR=1 FL=1